MRARSCTSPCVAAMLVALAACALPTESREPAAAPPRGRDFRPVALVLVDRCGSLDCHGSKYRNMRLYGFGSSRLDPAASPDGAETTDAEVAEDYEAVTALEPDVLASVVAEGARAPERLTLVRKSLGSESHEGGARVAPGDAADACIRSWLARKVDHATCRSAVPRLATP